MARNMSTFNATCGIACAWTLGPRILHIACHRITLYKSESFIKLPRNFISDSLWTIAEQLYVTTLSEGHESREPSSNGGAQRN